MPIIRSLSPLTLLTGKQAVILLLLSVCLFMTACESRDSASYIMDNYHYRLSNSLDLEPEPESVTNELTVSVQLLPYPVRRELQYTIPSMRINLLEFLRLSQCELQRHVAKKNGALGRVMEDTQHVIYDALFLQLADRCMNRLADDSELKATLGAAYEHKLQYLPHIIWNATIASKEFAYLFSLGAQAFTLSEAKQHPQQLLSALEKLNQGYQQLRSGQSTGDFLDHLEPQYQIIASTKHVGRLRLSLQAVTQTLQQADQLLLQRIQGRPLCYREQSNPQSRIVDTVFHKYYIQQVQTYLAGLHQQASALFLVIDQLVATITVDPQRERILQHFWQSVYRAPDSEWSVFNQAIETHTNHWQTLLRQCGQLPQ